MFQISPLPSRQFSHLFGKTDDELAAIGVTVMTADSKPGFPCRVSLRDAEPGERVLLLNHEHQAADTPYRSAHAIFVIDGAEDAAPLEGEVPEVMQRRTLSVRAFTADHMMTDADLVDGKDAARLFERLLADPKVAYLQAHYAKRGCYAARIERA
ncbi:MAG TPA: DUF1203 domain-containing protein [Hyphomonadaceae bacterium]|jgi:hypothetical protein